MSHRKLSKGKRRHLMQRLHSHGVVDEIIGEWWWSSMARMMNPGDVLAALCSGLAGARFEPRQRNQRERQA